MSKRILILACTLMLGGCAIPVPLQIASWAVDGLLFVTTEKTMADHGVSLVAQRDCAMLRVVTEGAFCRDDDPVTAVAGDDIADRLASLETAAGGEAKSVHPDSNWREALVDETLADETTAPAAARWQAIIDAPSFFDSPTESIGLESISELKPELTAELTPELTAELTAEKAAESTLGSAFDAPAVAGDTFDVQRGDDQLYLGDIGHDPFLNAQDEVTVLGGAGDDFLIGGIGSPRIPAPIQAIVQPLERVSRARRHRPPGLAGARGRDPPGRGRRRVHDSPGSREGPEG